jgi:hypothetical protein
MLALLLGICTSAHAQMFYLEPQIRTGAGVSWSDGALGVSLSMDSRITQLLYVSAGGFRSLDMPEIVFEDDKIDTWVALRHGIWAAPGIRYPHRYAKSGLNWDFLVRGGFGATFTDLANEVDWLLMEPAALYGGDFLLFSESLSVKASGKMFVYSSYIPEFKTKELFIRPQLSIELSYEW